MIDGYDLRVISTNLKFEFVYFQIDIPAPDRDYDG